MKAFQEEEEFRGTGFGGNASRPIQIWESLGIHNLN